MLIVKILFQITFIFSLLFSQTKITIYNQGRAFISEIQKVHLGKKGKQKLVISDIPNTVDPASINLFSDNIQFISKEFIKNPITNQSLLNEDDALKYPSSLYDLLHVARPKTKRLYRLLRQQGSFPQL